jgi:hypothetical protein
LVFTKYLNRLGLTSPASRHPSSSIPGKNEAVTNNPACRKKEVEW